jgi:hypothetical protein
LTEHAFRPSFWHRKRSTPRLAAITSGGVKPSAQQENSNECIWWMEIEVPEGLHGA